VLVSKTLRTDSDIAAVERSSYLQRPVRVHTYSTDTQFEREDMVTYNVRLEGKESIGCQLSKPENEREECAGTSACEKVQAYKADRKKKGERAYLSG